MEYLTRELFTELTGFQARARRVSIFGLVVLCAVLGTSSRAAIGGQRKLETRWTALPLWTVDTKQVGQSPPAGEGSRLGWHLSAQPICFTSDNGLVITYFFSENGGAYKRSNKPTQSSSRLLRADFIDTRTGHLRATKEWPVASPESVIIPAGERRFVLFAGDRIVLYSLEFQPLRELPLPPANRKDLKLAQVLHSPSGGTILVKYSNEGSFENRDDSMSGRYNFDWIDTHSLSVIRSWDENGHDNTWRGREPINALGGWVSAISDSELLRGLSRVTLVRRVGDQWRLMCFQRPECGEPQFVSNDTVLTLFHSGPGVQGENSVGLIGSDGKVLLAQQISRKENDYVRTSAVSAGGRRFALLVGKNAGEIDFLDYHLHDSHFEVSFVTVYDIPGRGWVYTLRPRAKLKVISRMPNPPIGLALSPSGALMAILLNDVLELFRLPDLSADASVADMSR